jgi:alanine racemase
MARRAISPMSIPEPPPLPPPATLRLRIDRSALAANWRAIDCLSGSAETGAAVKADAYGAGVDMVLPALLEAGARQFFVAHWGEVPAVLAHVPAHSIAVLHGVTTPQEAAYARATGVRPVINSLHHAQIWLAAGGGPCHLMLDTGINRLGLEPAACGAEPVRQLPVEVLLSHLASADEDSPQNARQLRLFHELANGLDAPRRSLANSAGITLGTDYHLDLVRPGLAIYGGVPCAAYRGVVRQAVFPQAAVLQLREIAAGDRVGYNATFRADRPMRVATISLGYADGLLRCWGAGGALQHGGQALPILGRVSMDMVVVDCSAVPALKEGDFIDLPYDLAAASERTGLSQYELLTLLGNRFDRENTG